jgi:hypothetical protein
MKRFAVCAAVFICLASLSYGQNINKTRYKETSLADYLAAGAVKERTDTELFKMEFTFVLQAANSVAVQDANDTLHRFESERKLNFERGDEIVLYVHSTHSEEGAWEIEAIDLAERKPAS